MNVSRMPTAQEINALPQHVQDYIHWLATDADPGHTLQRNYALEQENAGLREMIRELKPRVPAVVGGLHPKALPQEVQQTQRSHNEWPADLVDNAAIRQCMYRAEADFHKGSKSFLTKREQGHIMGLFRNVVTAFVNTIIQTRE